MGLEGRVKGLKQAQHSSRPFSFDCPQLGQRTRSRVDRVVWHNKWAPAISKDSNRFRREIADVRFSGNLSCGGSILEKRLFSTIVLKAQAIECFSGHFRL